MSNIKWSGIEQWKYGLTARWYVSAYYGNDMDVDAVGLYHPSTNLTGHGGPTRPFATLDKAYQSSVSGEIIIIDSGYYSTTLNAGIRTLVGDGVCLLTSNNRNSGGAGFTGSAYNCDFTNSHFVNFNAIDCRIIYSSTGTVVKLQKCILIDVASSSFFSGAVIDTNVFVRVSLATSSIVASFQNNIIIDSPLFTMNTPKPRPIGYIADYSVIIGTVKTNTAINGKTTGVTIEDFKADGNYFIKSYSEVDLFGNTSGSGATVTQLNEIFNNFYYPYIDDYQNLDLTLRPDCDERVRFGGDRKSVV